MASIPPCRSVWNGAHRLYSSCHFQLDSRFHHCVCRMCRGFVGLRRVWKRNAYRLAVRHKYKINCVGGNGSVNFDWMMLFRHAHHLYIAARFHTAILLFVKCV